MAAANAMPIPSRSSAFSGAVLTAGAVALFVGTLFYMRLTWTLGLPALPVERNQALADALSLGARKLLLAGGWAFTGDWLLVAACIALLRRRHATGSDLPTVGWTLMGVSAAIALVFDSMIGVLFLALGSPFGLGPVPGIQGLVRFSVQRRQRPVWAGLRRSAMGGRAFRLSATA
jgi:hypothetical protein